MATSPNIQRATAKLFDSEVGGRSNGGVHGRPLSAAEKAAFARIARGNGGSREVDALVSAGVSRGQAESLLREMDARDNPLSVEARSRVQDIGDRTAKSTRLIDEARQAVVRTQHDRHTNSVEDSGLSGAEIALTEARAILDQGREKLLSASRGRVPYRDNAGVVALALALPNPGGWDVPPPDLDFIRRNSDMAKRHVSQETLDNLARGRAIRAANLAAKRHNEARDNISMHRAMLLAADGGGTFYRPSKKVDKQGQEVPVTPAQKYVAKQVAKLTERTITRGPNKGQVRPGVSETRTPTSGINQGKTVLTVPGKFKQVKEHPEQYFLRTKYRVEKIDPPNPKYMTVATQADVQSLEQRITKKLKEWKNAQSGKFERKTDAVNKTLRKQLERLVSANIMTAEKRDELLASAEGKQLTSSSSRRASQRSLDRMAAEIRDLKANLEIAKAGGAIPNRLTAAGHAKRVARGQELAAKRKASRAGGGGEAVGVADEARGPRANRSRQLHRDNVGGSDILYGLGGFAGGLVGGVVVSNLANRVMPKTSDYIGYGLGALVAWDLYRSRSGEGWVFNRINNQGLRYGLAAGLILPLVARGLASKILGFIPGGFGDKVDRLLAGDAPSAAPAAATGGFGSVYDIAFSPEEDDNMDGLGRYVTTSGMGRYVETSGLGLDVSEAAAGMGLNVSEAAAGMGLNVSEAAAGMGLNVTEAAAGMGRYVATSGMGEYMESDDMLLQDDSGDLEGLGEDLEEIDEAPEMDDEDLDLEGLSGSVNSVTNKVVRATPAVVQRLRGAGNRFNLRILGPSKVARGAYIVSINRAKAESVKQALSTFPKQPSSVKIGPRPVADALRPGGIFGEPIFGVSARHD